MSELYITVEEGDRFLEALHQFLEGMPEVVIKGVSERRLVNEVYDGKDHEYIIDSFANFLDQVCTNLSRGRD